MYQVFINGEEIDIDQETLIPITYQVYRLENLADILSNYSKTIIIPHTDKNDKIFGFASIIESANPIVYNKFDCKVFKNGIEIITKGSGRLLSVKDNFELQIMFGNYDLLKEVQDKKLTELTTIGIDHIWNVTNVAASSLENGCFTKNYIYPIIEWGDGILHIEDTPYINLEMLLPCIKARYILDRIISESGYTLNPNSEDALTLIEDMYIPVVNLKGDDITTSEISQASAEDTITVSLQDISDDKEVIEGIRVIPIDLQPAFGGIVTNYYDQMKRVPYLNVSHDSKYFMAYRMGVNGNIKCDVHLKIVLENIYNFIPIVFDPILTKIQICSCPGLFIDHQYEFGVEIGHDFDYTVMAEIGIGAGLVAGDLSTYSKTFSFNGLLTPGEFIFVLIDYTTTNGSALRGVYLSEFTFDFNNIENIANTTGFGYHLSVGINLPDMTQANFLKHIFALRNLVVTTNQFDRFITIKKFKDVFKNVSISKDWSNKLDTKFIEVEFTPDGFYKRNWFKYKEEADELVKEIANGYFDINNEFLEISDAYFTSEFASTRMVLRIISMMNVPHINMINTGYVVNTIIPRVLMIKETTTPYDIRYVSDLESYINVVVATSMMARAYFIDFTDPYNSTAFVAGDDLHFQNALDYYYLELINMLQHYKKIRLNINIEETDIVNFDHFIPIWIKAFHSYFYVNSIPDYVDGLTQVELIKLY